MASDDLSGPRPAAPIVLRIKLRYDDVDVMVQRFATNVGKSGLFLPTKSLQPIGAEIKFELRLADDTPALVGLGRVKLARAPDPQDPRATFGMAIELMRVTPQSRALILRMLERRREIGLPELGLPTPEDIDAARHAEAAHPGATRGSEGEDRGARPRHEPHPGEALMTAPRRVSGSIAVANILAVAPLPPEPPRRKRMAVSELIESASGSAAGMSVAAPGLDEDVDLAAAIVRARALAGGELDAELDALCEAQAAPLEISIEAASAELAKQLGGSAVRRDRSTRWAPPLAIATPAPTAAPSPEPLASPDASAEPPPPPPAVAEAGDVADDGNQAAEPAAPSPIQASAEPPAPPAVEPPEAQPDQSADEIHQLDDLDMEDVEHTEMGGVPTAAASDSQSFAAESSVVDQPALAARLETQLALAEADAEADDLVLARALGSAAYGDAGAGYQLEHSDAEPTGEPLDVEEIDDFEILAEADADDADLLASDGEQDASSGHEIHALPHDGGPRPGELDFAARLDLGDESGSYYGGPDDEFSARHVLDDLHHLADRDPQDAFEDEPRLGDPHAASAGQALAAFADDEPIDDPDERGGPVSPADSADDEPVVPRRIVQPIFEPEPSSSFTLAGIPSDSFDVEPRSAIRAVPVAPAQPLVRPGAAAVSAAPEPRRAARAVEEPAMLRAPTSLPSLLDSPVEDYELENALEALDVDLDDLSIPHAQTELQRDLDPTKSRQSVTIRPASQQRAPAATPPPARVSATTPSRAVRQSGVGHTPGSGRAVMPRATTEDGVLIDFDDDD